jgi:arsenite methyltransferase
MSDPWSEWHKTRRHGGDAAALEEARRFVAPIRERVLEGARIQEGDTVLDAGCGDGLIGFGALPLVGERGTVIFDDTSEECSTSAARSRTATRAVASSTPA